MSNVYWLFTAYCSIFDNDKNKVLLVFFILHLRNQKLWNEAINKDGGD